MADLSGPRGLPRGSPSGLAQVSRGRHSWTGPHGKAGIAQRSFHRSYNHVANSPQRHSVFNLHLSVRWVDKACLPSYLFLCCCTRNSGGMAEHDLLPTFSNFLDPQLAFALLEFANGRNIYKSRDVTAAQVELLNGTNMVEYAIELYKELHGTNQPSQELSDRREAVLLKLQQVQEKANPIIAIIREDDIVQKLKADRAQNIAFLQVGYLSVPSFATIFSI
jgi:hypothetical protein